MTIDQKSDEFGVWEERWECEVPSIDCTYKVIEQEWNAGYTVRIIRRVEIQSPVVIRGEVFGWETT